LCSALDPGSSSPSPQPRTGSPGSLHCPGSGRTSRTTRSEGGVGRGQAGEGDPERRAGHVVQAHFMAEVDGSRVTAVFAADAELERVPGGPALGAGPADQFADALLV